MPAGSSPPFCSARLKGRRVAGWDAKWVQKPLLPPPRELCGQAAHRESSFRSRRGDFLLDISRYIAEASTKFSDSLVLGLVARTRSTPLPPGAWHKSFFPGVT